MKADDNRIENVAYVLLALTGVASIGLVIQPHFNFSAQGTLFYSIFATVVLIVGVLGLKRNALSREFRLAVRIIAFLCYLIATCWLMYFYYFAGKPA